MKTYKIKFSISLEQIEVDPFRLLRKWNRNIQLRVTKTKIRYHYKRLNWDKNFVWKKTTCCGIVDDACYRLAWVLIQSYEGKKYFSDCTLDGNRVIEKYCHDLIMKDFETGKF